MAFRRLDDDVLVRSSTVEGEDIPIASQRWENEETVVAGYHRPAGFLRDPHSADLFTRSAQRRVPSEPKRPWSMPGLRDMSERWEPSFFGAVPGRRTGPLVHSATPSLGDAPGAQRPSSRDSSHRMSSRTVVTAGLFTPPAAGTYFRYQPSVSESPSLRRQPSPDRRSTGGLEDPHSTGLAGLSTDAHNAGPFQDPHFAGPQRGPFVNSINMDQPSTDEPARSVNGPPEQHLAQSRGVSPYQRQHSIVRRRQHLSPTSPLIILDDAADHQAVAHRDAPLDIREVRCDRVRGRTPSRSRRRSRRYPSSRRRHRRCHDSSESSDSDNNYRSGTPHRATDEGDNPHHTTGSRSMLATGRPASRYCDRRTTPPMGPRSTCPTNPPHGHVHGVPSGQERYLSDGWTARVTDSRPAFATGQRTAPMTCPPSLGAPVYTYVTHQNAGLGDPHLAGPLIERQQNAGPPREDPHDTGPPRSQDPHNTGPTYGPVQHYRPVTELYHDSPSIYPPQHLATSTPRNPDHPQGGAPPSGSQSLPVNTSITEVATAVDITPKRQSANVGVKLGTYDGNSCLETFLASLRNFATYFKWNEEDELFHLRASLKGAAGQLLWDLGSDVTLAELIRLLRNRFGTSGQAERFRAELRTRKRRPGGQLQKLYNDICRLMSLAYPGPCSETVNVVGREAFLDALGDPSLRVRILDKGPTNMEETLRIALNLEAFDKSKEVETAIITEKSSKKERYVKAATKVGPTPSDNVASQQDVSRPSASDNVIKQLQQSINQCCSQMAQLQKDMTGLKQQAAPPANPYVPVYQQGPAQGYYYPTTWKNLGQYEHHSTVQQDRPAGRPCQPSAASAAPQYSYPCGQDEPPSTTIPVGTYQQETYCRPDNAGGKTTNPSARNNHAGTTPRRGGFPQRGPGRGRGPCLRCGQLGHWARNCPNPYQESTSNAPTYQEPAKVQVVNEASNKKDVYMPINLFGKKTVALLDTGCDTSIIGSRLLPKNIQLQTSKTNLLAANGTKIPLLGELEVEFKVAGRVHSTLVAVTEVVDEFILGIDFLTAEACQWDFGGGRVLLGNN